MRIISGKARGTMLETLDGEDTRPTLERVKENFFNAINFDVADAKVLDLFAGSGQLGLEALSRRAKEAVFIDMNTECVDIIRKNAQKAKLYDRCNIYRYDYSEYFSSLKKRKDFEKFEKFDIIFLDPPYESGSRIISDCIKKLLKHELISNGGLIICETGNGEKLSLDLSEEILSKIKSSKIYKYGRVYITILTISQFENENGDDKQNGE